MTQRPFQSLEPEKTRGGGTFSAENHVWFIIKLRSARGILWRVPLILICQSMRDRPSTISLFLQVESFLGVLGNSE